MRVHRPQQGEVAGDRGENVVQLMRHRSSQIDQSFHFLRRFHIHHDTQAFVCPQHIQQSRCRLRDRKHIDAYTEVWGLADPGLGGDNRCAGTAARADFAEYGTQMKLHGDLCKVQLARDLLVRQAAGCASEDFQLARR